MIYLLCPFDRPEFASLVARNWRTQTTESKLVVVANGYTIDGEPGPCSHLIELPHRSLSGAMAAGLEWIRSVAKPDDWVCKFDSDDGYSPDYVADVAEVASRGDAVWSGFPVCYVRLLDSSIGLVGREGSKICQGGTLAARVDAFAPYPDCTPETSEDTAWCRSMAPHKFVPRGPRGYVWLRHPGSVCPETDAGFRVLRGLRDPETGAAVPSTAADRREIAERLRARSLGGAQC